MKTPLSFYFIAAVAGALACSDEGGTERNTGGTGGTQQVGQAGSGSGTAGSGQGTAGSSTGTGGSGGAGNTANVGPAFTITGSGLNVVVQDTQGNTGITGGIVLAQSAMMATPAEVTEHEGQLCMKGATTVVLNNDYGSSWGAELSLDLNRAANPDAPAGDAGTVADAGGDAGGDVLGTVAAPWPMGNVIGFSYKITGMDPSITADQGVSAGAFRFKAVPQDANTAIDTYCSTRAPIHNATENVLFSDIRFECWATPPNPSLADDPIAFNVGAQGMPSTRPNPRSLMSISWQIPADINIGHQFDFCISELRPILAP